MKRPILLVIAVGVVAIGALLSTMLPGASAVDVSRSGITVRLDKAVTGTVVARVQTPAQVTAVSLFATMPQMGHLTGEITAVKEKPGLFRAEGELFSMSGPWELGVRADGQVVTFEITVR
ncbi:hypothetical protein [Kibdelosporangium phytohabitans]|uniref:YtkA-like domain-containing protein n=1 Tax=Kibdelosporangium phytohabitans TaxID=860235 RepID=A0A0N9I5E6_9PSEU|nr:hypothetical protein [Kibdelosporangium phytohabitans]ALG10880.1 hypothetical protein AOZ06_31915 [Kibdelosporangium phytohabitans]MBE1462065.1 hypothetical protein [Kibdelosporangium phytohabitans]